MIVTFHCCGLEIRIGRVGAKCSYTQEQKKCSSNQSYPGPLVSLAFETTVSPNAATHRVKQICGCSTETYHQSA